MGYCPHSVNYTLLHPPTAIYIRYFHNTNMESYTKINEVRAKILKKLKKGGKTVKNLYWDIGVSWHNCRYHLTELTKAGLVKAEKQTHTTLWTLTEKGHETLQYYE